jgi:hypothetical protein
MPRGIATEVRMNKFHATHRMAPVLLAAGLLTGVGAQAQSIKPGLWEHNIAMKSSSGELEKGMERMQAELAKMPPAQRKQIEQMMAQRGVEMSMGGTDGKGRVVKVCITPEQAARVDLPAADDNCRQMDVQRSGSTIRVKFACDGPPPSSGTSEFTLKGDKAYTGHTVVDTVRQGKPERMTMDLSGKWLASDCGNVRPFKR